jgi:predicted nucleic acid-binding protein
MEITIDSSVIMAVILNEATKPRLLDLTRGAELQSAPSLPWEVGNGLSALFRRARIDLRQAQGALKSFRNIPVRLSEIDLEVAVCIAEEYGISAYDAYVLECADRYRTPLLSLDRSQCAVAQNMGIEVLEI